MATDNKETANIEISSDGYSCEIFDLKRGLNYQGSVSDLLHDYIKLKDEFHKVMKDNIDLTNRNLFLEALIDFEKGKIRLGDLMALVDL